MKPKALPLAADAADRTPVLVIEDGQAGITLTKTRSVPWALGNGELVVLLEGRSGGYLLERCFDASDIVRAERQRSEALWQLLDDIDTASDAARGDLEAFYAMAMQLAKRRAEFFESDGYTLSDPGATTA